jgi:hypothetical protein
MDEQLQDLRFDPHHLSVAGEFEAMRIEREFSETPRHGQSYMKIGGPCRKTSETRQASRPVAAQDRRIDQVNEGRPKCLIMSFPAGAPVAQQSFAPRSPRC